MGYRNHSMRSSVERCAHGTITFVKCMYTYNARWAAVYPTHPLVPPVYPVVPVPLVLHLVTIFRNEVQNPLTAVCPVRFPSVVAVELYVEVKPSVLRQDTLWLRSVRKFVITELFVFAVPMRRYGGYPATHLPLLVVMRVEFLLL